jgi:hypothetical protein
MDLSSANFARLFFFQSARNPKLFWISAGAPLTSVIISTILSFIWKSHSISVVSIFSIACLNQQQLDTDTFSIDVTIH